MGRIGLEFPLYMGVLWIPLSLVPGLVMGFAGIGLSQLIYQLPAAIICNTRGRKGMMKGIIIGAAITFLLNAACFGILFGIFYRG